MGRNAGTDFVRHKTAYPHSHRPWHSHSRQSPAQLHQTNRCKLSDSGGCFLLCSPTARSCGASATVSPAARTCLRSAPSLPCRLWRAREKRDEFQQLIADGIDPARQTQARTSSPPRRRANTTFGLVAAEYLEHVQANGAAERDAYQVPLDARRQLAAPLAKRPIARHHARRNPDGLKRIEKSGRRETARRLRGAIGAVFRHAIVTLRATNDPTYALRGALLRPIVQHRAAITDEKEVGPLMLAIDEYDGWPTIRAALHLLALTMTRPGDVRFMRRSEINFERRRCGVFRPSG